MFLKNLKLTNFRNYSQVNFEFSTPVTVLIGNNAQGKSNFLESIYFLATTKSYKADSDEELIKSGEEVLRVEGEIDDKLKLEIFMQSSEEAGFAKKVKVNGVPRKIVDYIGSLTVISFSPEDINLVTGSPSLRRWHIDLTLAQIDRIYKNSLTEYEKVLKNKNRILKKVREGIGKKEEILFWTDLQVKLGLIITQKRKDFFEFLEGSEKKFGEFKFKYLPNELSHERLNEYQAREIAAAASLIGPHRDDFRFFLGEKDLAKYGSRGEHRTATLDLKVSEGEFIEHRLGERPILLLDDVFSELDSKHQDHVINLVGRQQTIIATVDLLEYLREKLPEASLWSVENGRLAEITET